MNGSKVESLSVLLVVPYFFPEIGSSAHIYLDLAKVLQARGHHIEVITSYPREFNLNKADQGREYLLEEDLDGIQIHRCRYSTERDNIFVRGTEHFFVPRLYFKRYKDLKRKFDVAIIHIPPLPLYTFAKHLHRYDGTPSVLNYLDFHPQELTDVGVMKNKILIKFMEMIEKRSYNSADYITVTSEGGVDYIQGRGCIHNRIATIYNGGISTNYLCSKSDFKRQQGIEDKFLITYAGILSPFQGLDIILDAAKEMKEIKDTIFFIVGDGMVRKELEKRVADEGISNVRFLPLQSRLEYQNIIASSDICLVSLDNRMRAPCIPGKLINLMGMSKPVLAIVPNNSETARLINSNCCGVVVEPGDAIKLKEAIICLKNDPMMRLNLGEKGRIFFENNMDLEKSVKRYEQVFASILKRNSTP